MRNTSLILISFLSAFGCSKKPEIIQPTERIRLPFEQMKSSGKAALWYATSNFSTGGRLGRIDLSTGEIARSIVLTGKDAILVPDRSQSFFLLTRMGPDSIAMFDDFSGKVAAFFKFAPRANLQWALRDQQGSVWVTSQEQNQVTVLTSRMTEVEAIIDLSNLKLPEGNADLSQIFAVDPQHVLVLAQRLHRSARIWKPDAQSGIAILNTTSKTVENAKLVDVVNPIAFRKLGSELQIISGGDYSSPAGVDGSVVSLAAPTPGDWRPTSRQSVDGRIIAVAPDADAMIVWQPNKDRSCVRVAQTDLVCQSGFAFNAVHRVGSLVFASFVGDQSAQLWVISTDPGVPLQRITLDSPIQSLTWGP